MSATAYIGFYASRDDPIGRFQTLLYLPEGGELEQLLGLLHAFFVDLPPLLAHHPESGSMATALMQTLEGQRGPASIKMADRLNVHIDWYYKVCLEGAGRLEVFQVKPVHASPSTPPEGSVEDGEISEHHKEFWSVDRPPPNWEVVLDQPLGLQTEGPAAEG